MSILSPVLITLLVCVIYAWAFQVWPPGWGPLAALLGVIALTIAGVFYYLKNFADEEERAQVNVATVLPSGVALFFALLMAMAWWLPPMRAGATRLASFHSAQPIEIALEDSDATVRKHACMELARIDEARRSVKLFMNFDRHPADVPLCIEEIRKREIGSGERIVSRVTESWSKRFRRIRSEADVKFACAAARPLARSQKMVGMAESGSPEILECALTAPSAEARACCSAAFSELATTNFEDISPEELFVRGVDPRIFGRMSRVAFGAKDLDPAESEMGEQLGLSGKENELIKLGCDMFESDRPDVRQDALAGMNHIASRLSCARISEGDEGAMLHLALADNWVGICQDTLDQKRGSNLSKTMCYALETSWEEAAFEEAKDIVLIALQRARLRRVAATVSTSLETRGYGRAGSKGQRRDAQNEVDRRLKNGESVFNLSRNMISRMAGQGARREDCIQFEMGNRPQDELNEQMGIWCGRDTDSLSEIMARRDHVLRAVQGKEQLRVGQDALRERYGDAAVKEAGEKMKETYEAAK